METYQKDGKTYFVGSIKKVQDLPTESLQPNQISQGLYKCSGMAKKLLAYTIANLKIITWKDRKQDEYETIFRTTDFIQALGFQKTGKKQKELIRDALCELQKSYIAIDTGEKFETFPWVTHSVYAEKEKKIAIELNYHLGKALMEIKKGYTVVELLELGKMQSFYAMRFYEIAKSLIGYAGKNGNKKQEWFFDFNIAELKALFQVTDYEGRNNNFIKKVVEIPIEEVNKKSSIHIEIEKIRQGREIDFIRFHCSTNEQLLPITKGDTQEIKDEKKAINDEEKYIAKHQARFDELLAEEKAQNPMPFITDAECFARANALQRLKDELEKKKGEKQ